MALEQLKLMHQTLETGHHSLATAEARGCSAVVMSESVRPCASSSDLGDRWLGHKRLGAVWQQKLVEVALSVSLTNV